MLGSLAYRGHAVLMALTEAWGFLLVAARFGQLMGMRLKGNRRIGGLLSVSLMTGGACFLSSCMPSHARAYVAWDGPQALVNGTC